MEAVYAATAVEGVLMHVSSLLNARLQESVDSDGLEDEDRAKHRRVLLLMANRNILMIDDVYYDV